MEQIKRRLMNGYVELQDGTFAKEVNGELIPVHEDVACAFEPEMFLDVDDMMTCVHACMDEDDVAVTEDIAMWTEKSLF